MYICVGYYILCLQFCLKIDWIFINTDGLVGIIYLWSELIFIQIYMYARIISANSTSDMYVCCYCILHLPILYIYIFFRTKKIIHVVIDACQWSMIHFEYKKKDLQNYNYMFWLINENHFCVLTDKNLFGSQCCLLQFSVWYYKSDQAHNAGSCLVVWRTI